MYKHMISASQFVEKLRNNKKFRITMCYMFGNVFSKAIALLLMPIITGMLPPSDYGIVNTYISWVHIGGIICGLSTGNTIRSAAIDYKDDLDSYVSSIFGLSIITSVVFGLCTVFAGILFFPQIPQAMLIYGVLQSFGSFVVNSILVKYMMSESYIRRTLLLILPNLVIAVLSIILIAQMDSDKYMGRIIPYSLVYFVLSIAFVFSALKKTGFKIETKYWKYALKMSLPLIFHSLSSLILASSDRTMLLTFSSPEQSGIYSAAYNMSTAISVITSSIEAVWIPWMTAKIISSDRKELKKGMVSYIWLGTFLLSITMLVLPDVFKLFTAKEYWSGINIVPIIALSTYLVFLYSISADFEYAHKDTKYIAFNTFVASVVNIGLNIVFIPWLGGLGAAFTTLIGYTVSFLMHFFHAKKLEPKVMDLKLYLFPILFISGVTAICYLNVSWIFRWVIAVILMGVFLYLYIVKKRFREFI